MKKIIMFGLVLFFACRVIGQKESFDIARFVPPAGWQRIDSNGMVVFANSRTTNNMTSFCQIFLCPSRPSRRSPMENFAMEWKDRVVRVQGNLDDPKPQMEKPDKGWTPVTGHVNITIGQNMTYTCVLVVATGFGRVMSIIINIAGTDFSDDARVFLEKMDLDSRGVASGGSTGSGSVESGSVESGATESAATGSGSNGSGVGPGSLTDYIYDVPPGWKPTQYPDGIVMQPPVSNTGEKCSLILWPMRPATDNLQNDAIGAFNDIFKGWIAKNGDTQNSLIRGTSAQGWDYFIIKEDITKPGGNYPPQFGFVCVIRLGNRVAAISGMSKDPLVSACFGLNLTDVWPKFFYSLRFKGWGSAMSDAEIKKRMAGVWMMATATVGDRWVFAPNGRYASAAAAQRYTATSSSEVLAITDAYFGNGSYSLKGCNIFFTGDNDKSVTQKGWYRLEEESKDGGNTWASKLYIRRISDVNGEEYEVGYHRQR
jgi:hypothetical protein